MADTHARLRSALSRGGVALVGIATVLVVLMVVVIAGSADTDDAAATAQNAVALSTAYSRAATGVAAEESLERKYRLQPGPVPLAAHRAAGTEVTAGVAQVEALGTPQDRALATRVLGEHARYLLGAHRLFDAVDRHRPAAEVNAVDESLVDPVFSQLQTEIYAAADGHRSQALAAGADMRRTSRSVLVLDVVTLLAGLTLIAVAGVALVGSQRRLRSQSEASRHQALHDNLTGLPNRELFRDRTSHALLAAQRGGNQVAVMLLDLNRFKDVNDTLGHQYGDLLLSQVAQRFTVLRAGDTVARLGGDEFAILLSDTTGPGAERAAGRVAEVLQEPFAVNDVVLEVEASVGIALAGPGADVDTVLRHADIAMYEAKFAHVPFRTYAPTRDDHTVTRLALLGQLRRAVGAGELVIHYQPKVSTATGLLHSVEALVRWEHPTRGLLGPDSFIPIAESTALIHPLTADVLRQALTQQRRWREAGWDIPVAVNISARSLLDPDFPEQVGRQLTDAGVPAGSLTLELTESAIMADPVLALAVVRALDGLGVGLSIDDFGTGYSSMAYLKALPVQELKIDRSFVMGMATDPSDVVLVQSAVDLGHNLGLHVVAEGVEDAATQDGLLRMGCDLVQGYHIRRPLSAEDLEPWLRDHAASTGPGTGRPREPV